MRQREGIYFLDLCGITYKILKLNALVIASIHVLKCTPFTHFWCNGKPNVQILYISGGGRLHFRACTFFWTSILFSTSGYDGTAVWPKPPTDWWHDLAPLSTKVTELSHSAFVSNHDREKSALATCSFVNEWRTKCTHVRTSIKYQSKLGLWHW